MKKKKRLKLEDLTPEARQVLATRRINGNFTIKHLDNLLNELSQFDTGTDTLVKRYTALMVVFIIVSFLGLFGGIFLATEEMYVPGFLAFATPVGLAIFCGLKMKKLKAIDLMNDFRTSVQPALRDLAEDIAPNEKLKVEMELSGAADSKQTAKRDLPTSYIKLTETVFDDPWCQLTLPLADGSAAFIEFSNCYRRFDRRYRARRGKIKSKTKWRKECSAAASLLPAGAGVFDEQSLRTRVQPDWEKYKLLDKDGRPGARLERYWVFKAAGDPPAEGPPSKEVVGMLLRLYGSWTPQAEVSR